MWLGVAEAELVGAGGDGSESELEWHRGLDIDNQFFDSSSSKCELSGGPLVSGPVI